MKWCGSFGLIEAVPVCSWFAWSSCVISPWEVSPWFCWICSCREHMYLDNGSALFKIAAFEKDQQLSSTPRNFSRKWSFLWNREKKFCVGYVFHMNIIRYCTYSFPSLADPCRSVSEDFSEWSCLFLVIYIYVKRTQNCKAYSHLF